nr:retrovirus-related Pol polyprotein from transposon TNT 1-94 [Tanacetum cinerariifolium]
SVQISSDPAPECQTMALEHGSLSPGRICLENVSHGDKTDTTSNELDLLFSLMFDELLNGSSKVVSKSSAVSAANAPNQRQQPTTPLINHATPAPTCQTPPFTTTVRSSENINQAGLYFNVFRRSRAAIAISCNPVQHSRTKHIDVRYHFIKEKVEKCIVELLFVRTEYQLADLFTKALPVERFQYLVRRLGMRCLTPAELEALANESA